MQSAIAFCLHSLWYEASFGNMSSNDSVEEDVIEDIEMEIFVEKYEV
jgi:hypothetical protein